MITFEEAQAAFLKAEKAAQKAKEKLSSARSIRDALCPHTEIILREYYFSGSYYDKAYSEYWNECVCCGKCSERSHEQHPWFG